MDGWVRIGILHIAIFFRFSLSLGIFCIKRQTHYIYSILISVFRYPLHIGINMTRDILVQFHLVLVS
jgi:hypothetical protein